MLSFLFFPGQKLLSRAFPCLHIGRKSSDSESISNYLWCRWFGLVGLSKLDPEAFFPLYIIIPTPAGQGTHDPLILGSFSFFLIIIVAILAYICLKICVY